MKEEEKSLRVLDKYFMGWRPEGAVFFSEVDKKNWQLKKQKNPSESLQNCTTSDAGIFNAHFLLLF